MTAATMVAAWNVFQRVRDAGGTTRRLMHFTTFMPRSPTVNVETSCIVSNMGVAYLHLDVEVLQPDGKERLSKPN